METEDPHAALTSASVATRCAGARDLARFGAWRDVPLLVDSGWGDKSMAVRLYAAAAAADIAQRCLSELSEAHREALAGYAFRGDPGDNPSMLMLAAYATPADVLTRLGRILRDPRSDVRLGALTALRRMVMPYGAARDTVAAALEGWFDDARISLDTLVELGRLVGEVGFVGLRPKLRELQRRGEGPSEVVAIAITRLDQRLSPEGWRGAWSSDGRGIYENRSSDGDAVVAVCDGSTWFGEGGARALSLSTEPTLDGRAAWMVFATPLGSHEAQPALQVDGRTWWRVSDDAFATFLDTHHEALRQIPAEGRASLRARAEALAGAAAERVRAAICWIAEDLDGCAEAVDAQLGRKRPRGDTWYWKARLAQARGHHAEASEAVGIFLDKAKKDHPLRGAAESLAEAL